MYDLYQFLTCSDSGHEIYGRVISDNDDVILMEDLYNIGSNGSPVVWKFEVMTLERWREMRDAVSGYEQIKSKLKTDEELLDFYQAEFLHDWWQEDPQ